MTHRICGVDLGGTKIEAVVVDAEHKVRGKARIQTPTADGPGSVVEAIIEAITQAAADARVKPSELSGVGIGAPGAVDSETGVLTRAPNIPGFEQPYPLAETISKAVGCPVKLGNDVGVAVRGELELGAGRELQHFVGIWWGTGVGSGVVLNRKMWHGRGAAGELGHTVIQRGGLAEPSGMLGTMEAYAGRRNMETRAHAAVEAGRETNLFALMEQIGKKRLSSRVWQESLESGDELAAELVGEAIDAIAAAAANVVNILDVEAIILGGGLGSRFGQPVADRVAVAMQPYLFLPESSPPVMVAELGDLGGAIGASLLIGKQS